MFDDFSEADIFREPKPGPFPEEDIDDKGEKYEPREGEDDLEECVPPEEHIPGDGDDECFHGEDERYPSSFFDLRRDEFLREGNHDEEGEDGDGCEPGAVLYASEDEYAEYGERNDGEGDGDAREIEQAKPLEEPAGEHADYDDRDENSDAIFHAIWIESEECEGDDGWRVDAERFDADDLPEQCDEGRDDREEEEERYGLERHAGFYKECNDRVDGHRERD